MTVVELQHVVTVGEGKTVDKSETVEVRYRKSIRRIVLNLMFFYYKP